MRRIGLILAAFLALCSMAHAAVTCTSNTAAGKWSADGTWIVTGQGTNTGAGATDGKLVTGVFTPDVAPGWTIDALINHKLLLGGTWYVINDNTATTATLTAPPADADYDWTLGGIPLDGDAVTIAAGHVVTLDADYSAYTNGFGDITITGAAVTPGELIFQTTGTATYGLKVLTTKHILGTNTAVLGKLTAGSSGTALPDTAKALIVLSGTGHIDATYLDLGLFCTQPAKDKGFVEVWGTCYTVTASGNTIITGTLAQPIKGSPIVFNVSAGGAVPAGLTADKVYYVDTLSGTTPNFAFTVSTASDGSGDVTLTDNGTATIFCQAGRWGPVKQDGGLITTGDPTTPANSLITWDGVPPVAGTAVKVRSSGTLPVPLTTNNIYYVRGISGNKCQLALQNSDATRVWITDVKTGNLTMYAGSAATTQASVNVVQDVSAEVPWTATDGWDAVVMSDAGPDGADYRATTISAITSRVITLAIAVNTAQYPLARIDLMSRNVSIQFNSTLTQGAVANGSNGKLQCEIRNIGTLGGYGVNGGTSHTNSGTISGCSNGVNYGTSHTNSGTISGCTNGVIQGTSHTNSGTISGCSTGVNGGTSHTNSGTISGCSNGVYTGTSHTNSGTISGCTYGVIQGTSHTNSGSISGCTVGVNGGTSHTNSGSISGCTLGVNVGGVFLERAVFSGNTTDLVGVTDIVGYGVTFSSGGTMQGTYTQASAPVNEDGRANVIYDVADSTPTINPGQHRAWMAGGYVAPVLKGSYTAGSPVDFAYVYRHTGETTVSTANPSQAVWLDIPISAKANTDVNIKVYVVAPVGATMLEEPTVQLIDPDYPFNHAPSWLVNKVITTADGTWDTITVTYSGHTTDRELKLRVRGAAVTGASNYFEWMYVLPSGAGGGSLKRATLKGGFQQ